MRSDNAKTGMQQAPARSLFRALGLTDEEMARPLIGIVSSYNEIVPGHMNLDKIVEAVKQGVAMAGGTPIVFPAIAVCDGIAMGHVGMKYSLVTRDLIADSTEWMAMAHLFDGLVMVPNCDKNVPGLLMAAARLNIPTVFVSGGPMLAFSGASRGASIGHVCPEAAAGGPIALVEEGDIISIDIDANTINMNVSEEELERRRARWVPKKKEVSGYLKRYRSLVTSADKGAVLAED